MAERLDQEVTVAERFARFADGLHRLRHHFNWLQIHAECVRELRETTEVPGTPLRLIVSPRGGFRVGVRGHTDAPRHAIQWDALRVADSAPLVDERAGMLSVAVYDVERISTEGHYGTTRHYFGQTRKVAFLAGSAPPGSILEGAAMIAAHAGCPNETVTLVEGATPMADLEPSHPVRRALNLASVTLSALENGDRPPRLMDYPME